MGELTKEEIMIREKYTWHNRGGICACFMCKLIRILDARDERVKELESLLRRVVEGLEPLNEVTNDGKKRIGWFKFMSSLKMLADLSEEIKKEVQDD